MDSSVRAAEKQLLPVDGKTFRTSGDNPEELGAGHPKGIVAAKDKAGW